MSDPYTAAVLLSTAGGLYAQNQAQTRQEQAQQRLEDAYRQRQADFERMTAPVKEYYQSWLRDPNEVANASPFDQHPFSPQGAFWDAVGNVLTDEQKQYATNQWREDMAPRVAVSQEMQDQLYNRAASKLEDAILKAQERARADALRRGIYNSGITGENLRDIEERGLEQKKDLATQIAEYANGLQLDSAYRAAQGLQNLANMQDPGMDLAQIQANFQQQAAQPWKEFASQTLAPSAGALADTLYDAGSKYWEDMFQKWLNPSRQKDPTQTAYRLNAGYNHGNNYGFQ